MKIGISALLYNLKEALEICKEENIAHIEIGIDNLEECNELLTYKDDFNKLDLSIGIHLPMELNACENINYIRKSWVDFVNRINQQLNTLDIKYINMHLGYAMTNRLNNNRKKYLDNALKFFNNDNLDKDIIITIENTYSNDGDFSNIGNKLKDFEYIFKSAKKDNLYFCYDTGHYLINKDRYLQSLREKIKVVHLSDNDGIKDTHIGIGKGILEKDHIKSVIEIDPEYLILEINYIDIKDTLIILRNL
ncbi:sugar phosphate isomerase/epimerase [Romboutsia sp. CE17]|uniref:sugar phosphate isomerase/epimerase family protein n=1 Tax=Romboutsia sp. CE17 TaxID=2724150 RepID=UPI001442E610|nr:sugar phosphate isomerase/epimerase [Romboutsia sp. CE17]QJA09551.1 sugar phosphate isomerase/epimerase [Romboutsia sp. CE17]